MRHAIAGLELRIVIAICLSVAALEGYDIQAFGVAAPRLVAELGLSAGQQGWAGSAAMLGLVIGAFCGGYLADRLGRRRILAASVLLFGVFSIATSLVGDFNQLLLVRLAAGAGFGGAMPNLIAIASEISTPQRRALTVTMMFCGLPAGAAIVAIVARMLGSDLSWRLVFVLGGLMSLVQAPMILWRLPETRPSPELVIGSRPMTVLLGGGRAPLTLLVWSTFALTLLIVYLMLNWLPTLVIAKGLRPEEGSTASILFNLASVAGALLLALLVDRVGFKWPLTLCYTALACVIALLAASDASPVVLGLSGLAGFLIVGPQCALYALIPIVYPAQARGLAAGAAVGMGRIGSILGPVIAGELRQGGCTANQVFLFMAPLALAAAAAVIGLAAIMGSQGRGPVTGAPRRPHRHRSSHA